MSDSFHAEVQPITEEIHRLMTGASWHSHPACPSPDQLARLEMSHWNFESEVVTGALVVARSVVSEVVEAFERIFAARFPIARMTPIYQYGGDDHASMAANNCSAFNFRTIEGTERLSQHALGLAIDINPIQNPWLRGTAVLPAAGSAYLDRSHERPGMIVRPGPVLAAFEAVGWFWGGEWPDTSDYHHFQKYQRTP